MITAIESFITDPVQASWQQAAYSGDSGQFAALMAQAQAQTGTSQGAQSAAAAGDPSALLAFQVAQLQASQNAIQSNLAAAQEPMTEAQQKSLYDSTVLQNLSLQASMAVGSGNAGAATVLGVLMNKQMQDMGLVPMPASPSPAASTAVAAPKTTTKTTTTQKTTAKTATSATTTATTASTASQAAASNASTASSASAALEDQIVSNASTVGVPSAELASNAGTTGETFANDETLVTDTWQAQVDNLAFELETLLEGMDENARQAALAGMQGLLGVLTELTAQT